MSERKKFTNQKPEEEINFESKTYGTLFIKEVKNNNGGHRHAARLTFPEKTINIPFSICDIYIAIANNSPLSMNIDGWVEMVKKARMFLSDKLGVSYQKEPNRHSVTNQMNTINFISGKHQLNFSIDTDNEGNYYIKNEIFSPKPLMLSK